MFKNSKGSIVLGLWMVVMMVFSLVTARHVSAQPADPMITVTQGDGGIDRPGTAQPSSSQVPTRNSRSPPMRITTLLMSQLMLSPFI